MDLDSWNVCVAPDNLTDFWNPLVSVQLACQRTDSKIKDGPVFKDWIIVALCGAYIRVAPEFKPLLYHAVKDQHKIILQNEDETAFIQGHHILAVRSFIRALNSIKCTAVRVTSYGMKERLEADEELNLGVEDHTMSGHNTFDLGVRHFSDEIVLVRPAHKTRGMKSYQILVPINEGFGTASFTTTVDEHQYKVKVYSPIIHCLKAMNPPKSMFAFNDISTCQRRLAMVKRFLANLRAMDATSLTGLRIEASVKAPTLSAAIAQINTTELLTPESYFNPTSEAMQPYQLDVKRISRETYLNNLETYNVRL